MKILFITCALLAITIGSFADNAAVNATDKPDNQQSSPVADPTTPPQTDGIKNENNTTAVPQTTGPTLKPVPDPKPVTVPTTGTTAHPNPATENKTSSSISTPDNKPTSTVLPPTSTNPTTLPTKETTTKPGTTSVTPKVTTVIPTVTEPQSTTAHPDTTMASPPSTVVPVKERHFDGLSFLGGIILTLCLMSLAAFSWKLYKDRRDGHYRTL